MKWLLLFLLLPLGGHAQIITTYVGIGTEGYMGLGGPATSAEIGFPIGLNFDDSDNLVICTFGVYGLVQKINVLTGIITTIAGSDTASSLGHGGDGGPATSALIDEPYDVCFDVAGNFYIADRWYSEVRKVTVATNIIDTFAGDRTIGNAGDGGPAKSAELSDPVSVCFDTAQRYLYISTEYGRKIRQVNMLTDTITTFAGTGVAGYSGDGGPATVAKFGRMAGICIDRANDLYIGDPDNRRIRRVDATTGIVTTFAGTGADGYNGDGYPATSTAIIEPSAMSFDKCGNLFFSDSNRVRRIDGITGIVTTIAGNGTAGFSGDGGLAVNAQLNFASGITIDTSGNLYISDYYNFRVRKTTYPNPFISISAIPGDTVCVSSSVTFQATWAGGGPAPVFQWVLNGTAMSGTTSSTYTYIPASGDSVSCILTSSSPCIYQPMATSNTLHLYTTTSIMPSVSIVSSIVNDTACAGMSVVFTATPSIGGTSPAYQWYVDGTLTGTTGNSYTYTPANGDSIRCILTSNATCALPATVSSNTINMVVNAPTTPTITLAATTPALVGSTVTVNATVANAGSSYNINWYDNGMLFNTTTAPMVTYTKDTGTDNITATVIPIGGCYDSTTSSVFSIGATTAINNIATSPLNIYPNPAHDILHIDNLTQQTTYTLLTTIGTTLQTGTLHPGNNTLPIQSFPLGIYLLELTTPTTPKTITKIVKQ